MYPADKQVITSIFDSNVRVNREVQYVKVSCIFRLHFKIDLACCDNHLEQDFNGIYHLGSRTMRGSGSNIHEPPFGY